MGLKGDLSSLKALKQRVQKLPVTVASAVAKQAAPAMTGLAQSAYTSGQNVYGEARPEGVRGNALTLERTGATRGAVRFVSVGTIVRCVLPTKYARYLIGRYGILPNGALPVRWSATLREIVAEVKP